MKVSFLPEQVSFFTGISNIPLGIQIVSVIIVYTVPFTSMMLDLNFNYNLKKREDVVAKVIDGELKPNVSYNSSLIQLPDQFKYLSKGGGDIVVERNGKEISVLFFTFRGVLDNFSGFMYRSDNTIPQDEEYLQVRKLKENWYWVASN